MRYTLFFFIALVTLEHSSAKPYKFREDGTYKVAQFTDTHFDSAKPESQTSIQLFEEVLITNIENIFEHSQRRAPLFDADGAIVAPNNG